MRTHAMIAAVMLSALILPGTGRAEEIPLASCTLTSGSTCSPVFSVSAQPYTRLRMEVATEGTTGTVGAYVDGTGKCLDFPGGYCQHYEVGGYFVSDVLVAGDTERRLDVEPGTFTLHGYTGGTGTATLAVYADGAPSLAICRSVSGPPPFDVNCMPQPFAPTQTTPVTLRIQAGRGTGTVTAYVTTSDTCSGVPAQRGVSATFASGKIVDGTTHLDLTLPACKYVLYVDGNLSGHARGEVDPR